MEQNQETYNHKKQTIYNHQQWETFFCKKSII